MIFHNRKISPLDITVGTVNAEYHDTQYRNLCGVREAGINVGSGERDGWGEAWWLGNGDLWGTVVSPMVSDSGRCNGKSVFGCLAV